MNEYLFKNMCNQVAKRHKMDPKNLSSFPNELLQQIFDYLPIADCQSIRDAYSNTSKSGDFNKVYDERVSLERYFRNSGFNGKKMMKILADCHALIAGPRALEYFVPGSTNGETKWDLVVSKSLRERYNLMIRMEQLGVKWESLSDLIKRKLVLKNGCLVSRVDDIRKALEKLRPEYTHEAQDTISSFYQTTFEDIVTEVNNFPMKFDNHSPNSMVHLYYDDTETINSSLVNRISPNSCNNQKSDIHGIIELNGACSTIILSFINRSRDNIVEFLHNEPISANQCVLTGFGAVHLYGKAASQKVSYRWDRLSPYNFDMESRLEDRRSIKECMDRGFTVKYKSSSNDSTTNLMNSGEEQSIRVMSPNNVGWDDEHFRSMQTIYLNLYWTESQLCTQSKRLLDHPNIYTGLIEEIHKSAIKRLKELDMDYLIVHGAI